MRKITALAGGAAAAAVVVGLIGFGIGRARTGPEHTATATPVKIAEPELVTGSIPAQNQASTPSPTQLRPPAGSTALLTPGRAKIAGVARQECANPDAIGVSRVVEIDTTGGPGFGFEQFKNHDFLRENEVVLTFDDGPWPANTSAVLKALAAQCTKAMFFPVGKHAMWHPEILKQVAAGGHTIGSHTWSHANLSKLNFDQAKEEFEKGASAVRAALGEPGASFFRFPGLRNPPEMLTYLGTRNFGIFSIDVDSFDFRTSKPEKVIDSVMSKLKKRGKGVVLLHDFQRSTSLALPQLLAQLKADGYKIVHVTGKEAAKTLPEYDEAFLKEAGGNVASAQPTSSIVRTVAE